MDNTTFINFFFKKEKNIDIISPSGSEDWDKDSQLWTHQPTPKTIYSYQIISHATF